MTFDFSRFQVSIIFSLYAAAAAVLVIPLIGNKLIDCAQAESSKVVSSNYFPKSLKLAQSQDTSSIRSDGTIIVNGKPIFLLGFYEVGTKTPQTLHDLDLIANAGFNFLHAGVNDNNYQQVINLAGSRGVFLCSETLDKIYQFKKQNPFCWNAADDANVNFSAEQVRDRTNEIKSVAPSTLSIIAVTNSGSSDALAPYVRAADIAPIEIYPNYDKEDATRWTHNITKLQVDAALKNGLPPFASLQTFGGYNGWKWPTAQQVDNMTYQAIVAGVKGFLYYTFTDGGNYLPDHPEVFNKTKQIAAEIKVLAPALLDGKSTELSVGDNAYIREWTYGSSQYLIAVNPLPNQSVPVNVQVAVGGELKSLFPERSATMKLSGNTVSGTLGPLEVQIYRVGGDGTSNQFKIQN